MDYTKLSKQVSYILRHHPEEYDIVLDVEGWCNIDKLLMALRKNNYQNVTVDTLNSMIDSFDKKRFEINDNKIRAYYGHSMRTQILKEECEPPMFLYHGTSMKVIENIKKEGIISMSRQYVHLSDNESLAYLVGKRRDNNPIIIKILAKEAWLNNIKFYHGNENTWLSDDIPSKFLKIE